MEDYVNSISLVNEWVEKKKEAERLFVESERLEDEAAKLREELIKLFGREHAYRLLSDARAVAENDSKELEILRELIDEILKGLKPLNFRPFDEYSLRDLFPKKEYPNKGTFRWDE